MSIIFFNFFGSRHAADTTGHGAGFIRHRSLADLFARGLWRIKPRLYVIVLGFES